MLKKKEDNAFDALKRISELEAENLKLKKKNKILRYEALPPLEKEGAERAYRILKGADVLNKSFEDFKCSYIDKIDMENKTLEELLPFDD